MAVSLALLGAGPGCDGGSAVTGSPGGGGGAATTGGGGAGGDGTTGSGTANTTGGNGGGGAGAGGDGGGGAAGNGGGGTGGSGGGAFMPGGDAEAVCQMGCIGGTCVGGTCFSASTFSVSFAEADTVVLDGTQVHSATIGWCGHQGEVPVWSIEVIGTFGVCAMVKLSPIDSDPMALHGGTVTVQSLTLGTVDLPPLACGYVSLPSSTDVPAGELIAFSSPGGADISAFSLEIAAPLPVKVTLPDSLQAGDPLVISWDPPPPPDQLYVALPDFYQIWCQPVEPSQLVVPGAVTSLFASTASLFSVSAARYSMVEEIANSAGTPVHIRASASSSNSVYSDFSSAP